MSLKSPHVGDLVRLQKGILTDVKTREWTFLGKSQGNVLIFNYKPKGRILKVVKEEDIDWDDYQKRNTVRPLTYNPVQT